MKKLYLLLLSCLSFTTSDAQISLIKAFSTSTTQAGPFESINNIVLFNVNGALWRSDGTNQGTFQLVASVKLDDYSLRRCNIGNVVFFWANSLTELWKTDGTIAGTVLVKAFPQGRFYDSMVNLNGLLLFSYYTSATGAEIWRSDGTEAGTTMVTELGPGVSDGITGYTYSQPTVLDGYFYFSGPPVPTDPGFGNRTTLYRTDGTASGTSRVANSGYIIKPGYVWNGRLIYTASYPYTDTFPACGQPTTPITIYVTVLMVVENGVASVLKYGASVNHCGKLYPGGGTFANTFKYVKSTNYLYFRAQPENSPNFNLWRTDGTTAGTIPLTDFASGNNEGPPFYEFEVHTVPDFGFTNTAYFPIHTTQTGTELWRSDGTSTGTYLLKDINPGPTGSGKSDYKTGPADFKTVNGITYFFAKDDSHGVELWKTDGSTSGTQLVQDLNPGTASQPNSGTPFDNYNGITVGNTYYFYGDNGSQKGLFAVLPPDMYSIKAGNWNDPTVWSGNRLPLGTDKITLNHVVTLPSGYTGQALRLIYSPSGQLIVNSSGKIQLGIN
ncbi:hypothetical protein IC229_14560 [Spirosoma sp. BT702]|uniref:Bulb-type lectin domain-containing protein n=1 Tax=Spirosoma profusum TaxID=2771354 RepID=A0A926XW61_9BACT|nr:hypothetical protein [Spirosoma profusum]MBD2701869.1 hypothetical protein [Spirosoma profusum]